MQESSQASTVEHIDATDVRSSRLIEVIIVQNNATSVIRFAPLGVAPAGYTRIYAGADSGPIQFYASAPVDPRRAYLVGGSQTIIFL
jgi:hypothetical protein